MLDNLRAIIGLVLTLVICLIGIVIERLLASLCLVLSCRTSGYSFDLDYEKGVQISHCWRCRREIDRKEIQPYTPTRCNLSSSDAVFDDRNK